MKIDKNIIRYADGEMNRHEREQFEIHLNADKSLKEQLNSYKQLCDKINDVKNIEAEQSYFTGIIPAFREKEINVKRNYYWKFALGFPSVILIIAAVLFFRSTPAEKIDNTFISDYSLDEVDSILGYYPQAFSIPDSVINNSEAGSIVDGIVADELNISPGSIEQVLFSNNDIAVELTTEETDIVYNEILNKRFF